jgi:uncharacterized membrane protein YdbT with pleckstrin-like domain
MKTELKKEEKILIIIRQHWLRLVLPFFAWLLLTIILLWWLGNGTALIIILLTALYPVIGYLNWKNNIWCVTNMRVVDESGFFSRYSKESPLDKINNVEYDQTFWGRILGFGSVDIQTAAELGETRYEFIHHPKLLKDTITHAREENKNIQVTSQANQLAEAIARVNPSAIQAKQLIADELNKLFELMQKGAITPEEYIVQKKKLIEG